ncbi:hypothetical protein GCM10028815_03100 [Mariniluteicoccus flavus]
MMKPCLDCGTLSTSARCPAHTDSSRPSTAAGYDWTWRKLSLRARRIQPWCSDCGTTHDLTADHSPEAWEAKEAGRVITLAMIDVVCRRCNSKRGAARGERPGGERFTPEPHAPLPRQSFGHSSSFNRSGGAR